MNVAVVDSGGANLASVLFALERLGARAKLTRDPDEISKAPRVLLPGVGAAGACMQTLRSRELIACLRELRQPALGICLGMQLLYESSEEGAEGDTDCLGLIPGRVTELQAAPKLPVPHMGWNRVLGGGSAIFPESESGSYFYFVHSFVAPEGPGVRGVSGLRPAPFPRSWSGRTGSACSSIPSARARPEPRCSSASWKSQGRSP